MLTRNTLFDWYAPVMTPILVSLLVELSLGAFCGVNNSSCPSSFSELCSDLGRKAGGQQAFWRTRLALPVLVPRPLAPHLCVDHINDCNQPHG